MKTPKHIALIALIFSFLSCEDVIDVDLKTAPPKLVVEASINWQKGTSGTQQFIKLSTTTGYFEEEIPAVSGAKVYIENSSNEIFDFVENGSDGLYVCNNFKPQLNEKYKLHIAYLEETFVAEETMLAVPDIKRVEQTNDGGFSGEDIEVRFIFDDIPNESNYYLDRFKTPIVPFPEYNVQTDEFFENNEMFALYFNEDLKAGNLIEFTLYGISLNYFNYMSILLAQGGSNNGGPFQTPSSTVRGNIVNETNFDNFALGYFRLSQTDAVDFIVQ